MFMFMARDFTQLFVFVTDTCKDSYPTSKCQDWKANGECIVNKQWMEKFCKQTCKACKESGADPDGRNNTDISY